MRLRGHCGFSITELLVAIALMAILAGIGVPMVLSGLDSMQLSGTVRSVQSELQAARLKAVSANRAMRVRFNCPAAGEFRMVELLGTPSAPDARDGSLTRCSPTSFPYPPADVNALTRPNHDGPVQRLGTGMTFASSPTIEFWPDGTAHMDTGAGTPWPAIMTTANVVISYKGSLKAITVNGVGKVQIQ